MPTATKEHVRRHIVLHRHRIIAAREDAFDELKKYKNPAALKRSLERALEDIRHGRIRSRL